MKWSEGATRSSKPVLRKLAVRLDSWDYRLDLNTRTLRLAVLGYEWVKLELEWYSYLDKYFNGVWKLKEILVSCREDAIWVYLVFEKHVELEEPRTVMGVDVNFNNITYTIVDLK